MRVSLNKLIHLIAALLIAAIAGPGLGAEARIGGVPLPTSAKPSAADSPFAGAWFGRWGGAWRTILVVEEIVGDRVQAIYAVGPNGSYDGGFRQIDGRIQDQKLILEGPNYVVEYEVSGTGRVFARYNSDQGFAVMSKGGLTSNPSWAGGASEMLVTDLTEDDAPLALETVIYKPNGDGPFPLAVIHHGSTGTGADPAVRRETFQHDWLAEMLVARGWLVAYPQRRGRGGSDGRYDEGFTADRSRYSCDADRSLTGAERALQDIDAAIAALRTRPDVSTGPILIGGMSRGGALSVAWAGRNPDDTRGVLNFVGGWLGEGCGDSSKVNRRLFQEGGSFPGEMLWLYGHDDPFYSIIFSRQNHAAFEAAGGMGAFHDFNVKGDGNGHWLMFVPSLWGDVVTSYLDRL